MSTELDEWSSGVPGLDPSAPMMAALGTAYSQTGAAVSALAAGLRAAEERAAERERAAGDRLATVAAAVESLAATLAAVGARLDHWEEQGAATAAAHAGERRERHAEVLAALAELSAGLGVLGDQVPAALVPVLDALRHQEEEVRALRELAGVRLAEIGQGQAEAIESLRVALARAGEEAREHADAHHQAQAEAIERAAATVAGEVYAVRDEVLADGAGREARQGEALREGFGKVRRDVDQVAGIVAGVAAAVDRTSGEVDGVRQAVAQEAEAVRALAHGAAEETGRALVRLGEEAAARATAHHREVTGELAALAGWVDAEVKAVRTEAQARGEVLRDQVAGVAGDVEAAVALLGEVPGQVERSTGAAAAAVERTGAALAARVEAAGAQMTGRTDRLCEMLAESGRAADQAVVSLGQRVAHIEERTGNGATVVPV
ncbi:hypothetical protein ACF064_01485 [Streptomyces sp. NPDC015492]|uniref:hypothetical protein n=1 Tax=Streptomyces sp. NPDC015492 TaxID=3364958 RepID=UPI0036F6D731